MTNDKKKRIDSILMDSKYGKWLLLVSEGKVNEAKEYAESICKKYPYTLENLEIQMSDKAKKEIKSWEELQEYLELLDKENQELVEQIIIHDVFSTID